MTVRDLVKPAARPVDQALSLSGRGNTSASVSVRDGDLKADRELLIALMSRNLPRCTDGATFDWLYRENPYGEGRVWLATVPESNVVIGAAGAFARRMYVDGGEAIGWVLGDFFVDDQYRSLGPALALQRACLEAVTAGTVPFCYDFPSASMMAVYRRLRIEPFGEMTRLAKALRVNRKLRKWVSTPLLNAAISACGNLLLRLQDGLAQTNYNFEISTYTQDCGNEFSDLAKRIGSHYGVCIQRSAEYLNWRYRRHPFCRYEMLTAHRDGGLLGYGVFCQSEEEATLADLFGIDEPIVMKGLMDGITRLLRARGVATLSASLIDCHPWIPLFLHLGFQARDASPVVIYGPSSSNALAGLKWFVMHGDRDS
jgi:hypothetical protein